MRVSTPPLLNAGVLQAIIPRPTITGAEESVFTDSLKKALADSELISSSAPGEMEISPDALSAIRYLLSVRRREIIWVVLYESLDR
jgi:hypothetical protein